MKKILIFTGLLSLLACNNRKELESGFRLIAEYEPTEYVWVYWAEGIIDKSIPPMDLWAIEISREILPFSKVLLVVEDTLEISNAQRRFAEEGLDTSRVDFMVTHSPGALADTAPVMLATQEGGLATIDFGWLCYGLVTPDDNCAIRNRKYDVSVARKLDIPVLDSSRLVWEGGAKEYNSKGTMLLVEQHELQRNPHLTKEEIEREYLQKLNLKKIIWLKKGLWEDEFRVKLPGNVWPIGAGAHIDEFCRVINDTTIMLAFVSEQESISDSINAENYQRMEENYAILKNSTDQDDKPFHIIRVPVAEHYIFKMKYEDIIDYNTTYFPETKPGDSVNIIAASSYLNFLMANDVVITAKYWKEGRSEERKTKDSLVSSIFKEAFPGKKIVQIDMEGYNNGGGGIHCTTNNQPFRGGLKQ